MASATGLKQRYSRKWRRSKHREKIIYDWLRWICEELGLEVYATGVGTLSDEYVDESYSSLEDKFDFIVYAKGKPSFYIDATGFGGREPCFLSFKVLYALKHGVTPCFNA